MALRRLFGALGALRPLSSAALLVPRQLALPLVRLQSTAQDILMQFFDDKKNWNEEEVRVGRSWRREELRIKSNSDLHKLWYVLLKERNMLMTMEAECAANVSLFPNPERVDKVKESMENLEAVVRERNKAFHQLETGEDGERPVKLTRNAIGMRYNYKMAEHVLPKNFNKKWSEKVVHTYGGYAVKKFLAKYHENLMTQARRKKNRERNHVLGLLKRFPDMNMDALKQEYPRLDIEKLKNYKKARGHFIPKEYNI